MFVSTENTAFISFSERGSDWGSKSRVMTRTWLATTLNLFRISRWFGSRSHTVIAGSGGRNGFLKGFSLFFSSSASLDTSGLPFGFCFSMVARLTMNCDARTPKQSIKVDSSRYGIGLRMEFDSLTNHPSSAPYIYVYRLFSNAEELCWNRLNSANLLSIHSGIEDLFPHLCGHLVAPLAHLPAKQKQTPDNQNSLIQSPTLEAGF